MLLFGIDREDLPGPWSWRATAWFSGRSWIRPFRSPLLRAASTVGPNGVTVAVREQRADGDHVEMSLGRDHLVTLVAGQAGVAPVHVATDGRRLVGSWDPVDLASFASADTLSPVVVARLLTHRHRYSADTLFSGITRVTAGAMLTWSPTAGMALRYPAPARHVARARRLRPGADPVAYLGTVMDDAVREVCEQHRGLVAVELSGGLDSANVAASVARSSPQPVGSGGLLVAGATGPAQAARRRAIADHLGLRDIVVPTSSHLPLAPTGPRTPERPHYPDTDVYLEAFDTLLVVCVGNTLSYLRTDDELTAAFDTIAAHSHPGTLLALGTLTGVGRDAHGSGQIDSSLGAATVDTTSLWDPATRILTSTRTWRFDDGRIERDVMHRRFWDLDTLATLARATGFDILPVPPTNLTLCAVHGVLTRTKNVRK